MCAPLPFHMIRNMKTIAITIDEPTLEAIDRLAGSAGASRRRGSLVPPATTRSALIRVALREFVMRADRAAREAADQAVFARHREKLARQARALVEEQAER